MNFNDSFFGWASLTVDLVQELLCCFGHHRLLLCWFCYCSCGLLVFARLGKLFLSRLVGYQVLWLALSTISVLIWCYIGGLQAQQQLYWKLLWIGWSPNTSATSIKYRISWFYFDCTLGGDLHCNYLTFLGTSVFVGAVCDGYKRPNYGLEFVLIWIATKCLSSLWQVSNRLCTVYFGDNLGGDLHATSPLWFLGTRIFVGNHHIYKYCGDGYKRLDCGYMDPLEVQRSTHFYQERCWGLSLPLAALKWYLALWYQEQEIQRLIQLASISRTLGPLYVSKRRNILYCIAAMEKYAGEYWWCNCCLDPSLVYSMGKISMP